MITLILQELLSLGMCSEIENRLKNKFENENCVTQRLFQILRHLDNSDFSIKQAN